MRKRKLTSTVLAASALIAGALLTAPALFLQSALAEPAPPPPKPYQAVAIQPAQPYKDPSFDAFRKQLAGIAQKKDKAALGRIIAQNFFWIPEGKDTADKSKSPLENFAKAVSLDGKDGWLILSDFAQDGTADPHADRKGVICAPGGPKFDQKAADALQAATKTQPSDWGYPVRNGVEVRQSSAKNARVVEKLGLHLVWSYPDEAAKEGGETLRIVPPSGKVGYVKAEDIRQLFTDQVCYVKDGAAWKIAGVIGTIGGSD